MVYLQIKEVAPKASSSNATQIFWTKDIKVQYTYSKLIATRRSVKTI